MIKAVIFDMFETLVTHYACPVYFAKQMSADIGITEARFREIWNPTVPDRTLGIKTIEEVIEDILRTNDRYSGELFELILKKWKQFKIVSFRNLHPQILPMLAAIRGMGLKIGLITNCYFEERDVIRSSVLLEYFDAVCMSCELGLQKPDVEIFRKCTQALALPAEACLYIGDGGSMELETAKAEGMHPIQATWYFKEGVNHPAKRNAAFVQAEAPMDILTEIQKHNEAFR